MKPTDEFKILTVRPPWADLIALEAKEYETRTRRTHWRGWVAIHSGLQLTDEAADSFYHSPAMHSPLARAGITKAEQLTRGRVVALVRFTGCFETEVLTTNGLADTNEQALGNFAPGRFGWKMADVLRFKGPKIVGKQGLFAPTETQRAEILAAYHKVYSR